VCASSPPPPPPPPPACCDEEEDDVELSLSSWLVLVLLLRSYTEDELLPPFTPPLTLPVPAARRLGAIGEDEESNERDDVEGKVWGLAA